MQLAHSQRSEGPVRGKLRTQQDGTDFDAPGVKQLAADPGRSVQDRDRLADERQGGADALTTLLVRRDGEMTGLTPGGSSQPGEVERKPLLELARPTGRDQGRTGWPAADVDQEAGAVGLGAGTGKRRGGGARAARRADRGDQDDRAAHGPAGLA